MSLVRTVPREARDMLGEGLCWSAREGALYWTDIIGQKLHRLRLADDRIDSWPMPDLIGWVIERQGRPGFIAGLRRGFAELTLDPFEVRMLATPEPDLPGNRLNDAVADRHGHLWAGTMAHGGGAEAGSLYRLAPDATLARIDTGYIVTNGPAISADGKWLYHNDSARRRTYRFPLDEQGNAGPRALFFDFEAAWGEPDGMTVDAEDGLWIAHWGAGCICRYTPDGARERTIRLPASQVSNVCFAGADLDRMFVTSASHGVDEPLAGSLFEVAPGVRGLPPQRFAG